MLCFFRKYQKPISIFTLLVAGISFLPVSKTYALSSGPNQPEMQQFAPAGMDNMVDPFTGDFTYNIPLMDVGGYPINLNYAAGITPDQEASWTGLGWNLNVGAINRTMRGIPDELDGNKGDVVKTEYTANPNYSIGVNYEMGSFNKKEIWGIPISKVTGTLTASVFYNSYNGVGMSVGYGQSAKFNISKSRFNGGLGYKVTLGSEDGVSFDPSANLSYDFGKNKDAGEMKAAFSAPFNSHAGLKGMSFGLEGGRKSYDYTNLLSGNVSTFKGFAWPSFTPRVENSSWNVNIDFAFQSDNIQVGSPNIVLESYEKIGGFFRGEYLNNKEMKTPAFGYLNIQEALSDKSAMMDFNREKENIVNEFTNTIGLATFTQDIFSVSGQGVAGTYRLYRSDIGLVRDPNKTVSGHSPKFELEYGAQPSTQKFAFDLGYAYASGVSEGWEDGKFTHYGTPEKNNLKELTYFKKIGEMKGETDPSFINSKLLGATINTYALNNDNPSGNLISYEPVTLEALPNQTNISANPKRSNRVYRSEQFSYLTADEAEKSAHLPILKFNENVFEINKTQNYASGTSGNIARASYAKESIPRLEGVKKGHHFSEMKVTDAAGNRYVYGLPVYNMVQKDVSFSINNTSNPYTSTNLIAYKNQDASLDNNQGLSQMYRSESIPAYAHSYLLTCILSPDYVDSDAIQGPSDGDLGSYTLFNYTRVVDKFCWRTPLGTGDGKIANQNDNLFSKNNDDIASYSYGEKEIWYLHSIETRTHVAEFVLSKRDDGFGVNSETDPRIGGAALRKLEKIDLYAKVDKLNSSAEPIKTVHFQYNYALCKNTINSTASGKGKLTLNKVWFTYGNTKKGILNPFVFNYAEISKFQSTIPAMNPLNPEYNLKSYDRWGNYKSNNTSGLKNAIYPYAEQNRNMADQYAAVYSLSSIKTPTGGTIHVYYEADDYAYVQDKRAMRMFPIEGLYNDNDAHPGTTNYLYTNTSNVRTPQNNNKLVVNISEIAGSLVGLNANQRNTLFKERYLKDVENLYFKVKLNVVKGALTAEKIELVPGYSRIDMANCKVYIKDQKYYGVIALQEESVGDNFGSSKINPITRVGWMYAKQHFRRELMGSVDAKMDGTPGIDQLIQVGKALLSAVNNVRETLTGYVTFMLTNTNSSEIDPAFSFVRLNDPDFNKVGGGHRVKAIIMSDNWSTLTNSATIKTSFYGQKYTYTKEFISKDANGADQKIVISSGVAAYEPIIGGDENPFRQPVYTTERKTLAPSVETYLDEPFGESLFPSPMVGYSKVTITPLRIAMSNLPVSSQINAISGNGTGTVEHEFYTAQDFPTIAKRSTLQKERFQKNINLMLYSQDLDFVSASQGFYIELNDMHGKQKSQMVKDDKGKIVSSMVHQYKTETNSNKITSKVTVINPDLTVKRDTDASAEEMGVEIDMVNDVAYHSDEMIGGDLDLNFKFDYTFVLVPLFGLVPVPAASYNYNRVRTISTTKVVNRYAIEESVTAYQDGSTVTSTNLAWDKQTGDVLLTSTVNEYDDPVYKLNIPIHWAYERAKQASVNEGAIITNLATAITNQVLYEGDELHIEGKTGVYYVVNKNNTLEIQNKSGEVQSVLTATMKIIRSGRRNMAGVPVGNMVSLQNPIPASGNQLVFDKILSTEATLMGEVWKRYCNCDVVSSNNNSGTSSSNPYILGTKGNLKPLKSYTYLTDRLQTSRNNNINVRNDGVFSGIYVPFWNVVAGKLFLQPKNETDAGNPWQFVTEIKNYNALGMEIENKDALGRYSMAQFGYGRKLPIAISNNSQYRESGFDGFEDYDLKDCMDNHFSWRQNYSQNTSTKYAHTGRRSIQVGTTNSLYLSKDIGPCGDPGKIVIIDTKP